MPKAMNVILCSYTLDPRLLAAFGYIGNVYLDLSMYVPHLHIKADHFPCPWTGVIFGFSSLCMHSPQLNDLVILIFRGRRPVCARRAVSQWA